MLDWLRRWWNRGGLEERVGVRDPMLWSLFTVSPSSAGITVNESTALNCAAYWSGIRLLSETFAMCPARLYERRDDGPDVEVRQHNAVGIVRSPNPAQTAFTFYQTGMAHVLTRGNVYAEITTDGNGRPAEMWLLDPDDTEPELIPPQNRRLRYTSRRSSNQRPFDQSEVVHVPGLSFDGVKGKSVVEAAKEAIGLALGAERYGATWFGSGGMPSGVLENEGKLSDEAMERQRQDWYKIHEPGAHKIAVLRERTKFTPFENDPQKGQALELRKFQVLEIARILRIPPHLLYDLDRATFSNIDHQSLEYVIYSLASYLVKWEQELTRKLLTSAEQRRFYFRFDVQELLRGDYHNRVRSNAILMDRGARTPNEVREEDGYPPLPGGDVPRVPLNTAPISSLQASGEGNANGVG